LCRSPRRPRLENDIVSLTGVAGFVVVEAIPVPALVISGSIAGAVMGLRSTAEARSLPLFVPFATNSLRTRP
jgi:hypothetical protein